MKTKTDIGIYKHPDVIVMGGGPSGALCAAKLSSMQYRVLLVDQDRTSPRIEGLSPRSLTLLHSNGLHNSLAVSGPRLPRTVHWGEKQSSLNGEHLVYRPEFDQALRLDAQNQGVKLIKARIAGYSKLPEGEGWEVRLDNQDVFRANFLIEARGRSVQSSSRVVKAPANVALSASIDYPDLPAGTHLNTLENGWLWLARRRDAGAAWAQLMIHSGEPALDRTALTRILEESLGKVCGSRSFSIKGKVLARGADFRINKQTRDENILAPLRIGDAGTAFDPLSGHGMFWAFSSALSATAITNTLLKNNSKASRKLCAEFYRERMNDTFWRQARTGRDFYRLEIQRHGTFWSERKAWPDNKAAHDSFPSSLTYFRGPAIENGEVVEQDLVHVPGDYGPSAWFGSIPLASTLRSIQRRTKESPLTFDELRRNCLPEVTQACAEDFWHWLHTKNIPEISIQTERGQ